ncbi:hypothetical protein MUN82_13325 [Hymenobacter aerilatus]|uniref:Uncharacterized protein n=1 Tax=Hymenobacter aerilatus TaxID=2932251 RepID=A0A8T9SQ55_9BACT|nr:hypothetical protein [Hymenobacter aerilatus]UOR03925.1 hypothetical protein MUN82_13325 [Hymenobacter aerilatus]
MKTKQNSIGRMRRNARWELGFTLVLLVGSTVGFFYVKSLETRTMLLWLILIGLVSLVSYHRHMLSGIQELSGVGATIHTHITQRVAGLRQLLQASYRSSVWVLCITFGIVLSFALYKALTQYSGRLLLIQLVGVGISCIIAVVVGYFVRRVVRQVLQDLYGRHLDHLEATLRELNA